MTDAQELWYAFQTWRDGVEFTHDHYSALLDEYVGPIPAHKFRDAEKVLLRYLPDLLRNSNSDSAPGREVAS